MHVDGETAVVQGRTGRRIFRSTYVKPYLPSMLDDTFNGFREDSEGYIIHPTKGDLTKGHKGFQAAHRDELNGLVENVTFISIPRNSVPVGKRIFGSRFIDVLKDAGKRLKHKSRLVAQNYKDE